VSANGHADRIECDSAGTIDYHTGKKPDSRMRQTLVRRGIPVEGRARQFQREDFERFDLILTMDEDNRAGVLSLAVDDEERNRVRAFVEFCEEHDAPEVPDPYYGGDAGFEFVADLIEDGSQGLLKHIVAQIG
jgi:protein-tyrosine phosphatase